MRPIKWLGCLLFIALGSTTFGQQPESKDSQHNKGSILEAHTYKNPALGMTIVLPGAWHFFDPDVYSTPESRAKLKEEMDREKAICQGPLCGAADVDVALQSPVEGRPQYGIFITAFKLSAAYQNRQRFPLLNFARVMTASATQMGWVLEGDLVRVKLAGRPAYRLNLHNERTTTAKAWLFVADSNGYLFMLLATALSEPDRIRTAVEEMEIAEGAPLAQPAR